MTPWIDSLLNLPMNKMRHFQKKKTKLRPLLASPPTNRPTWMLSRIGYGPDIWSMLSLFFN